MDILLGIIGTAILLVCVSGWLVLESAWTLGGDYYLFGNYARRKNWIEKILDGLEVLRKM